MSRTPRFSSKLAYDPQKGCIVHVRTEFFEAAVNNDFETIKKRIENGYDINAQDSDDELVTALHIASRDGYTDMTRFLLEAGADPAIRDIENNETPEEHLRTSCRAPARERILRLLRKHQGASNNEGRVDPVPGMRM